MDDLVETVADIMSDHDQLSYYKSLETALAEAGAAIVPATLIEQLREENSRLREGWQDIATAPKDGTEVLILTERGSVFSPCVWQEAGVISEEGFWLVWRAMDFDEIAEPTFWQPLPAPPSQGNVTGEDRV